MALEPREIPCGTGRSPIKGIASGVFIIAICILDITTKAGPHTRSLALLMLVGLVAVLVAFQKNLPGARFILDEEGFGYVGQPRMARWEEVESFGVMDLPRGRFMDQLKVITIKFRPGVNKWTPAIKKINNVLRMHDACILFTWPRPHEIIAEELDIYRRNALQRLSHCASGSAP